MLKTGETDMSFDRTKIRWNGWGWAAHKDDIGANEAVWTWLAAELGMPALLATPARPLEELSLQPSALSDEDRRGLRAIVGADSVRDDAYERAFHALGRSYHDLLRLRATGEPEQDLLCDYRGQPREASTPLARWYRWKLGSL